MRKLFGRFGSKMSSSRRDTSIYEDSKISPESLSRAEDKLAQIKAILLETKPKNLRELQSVFDSLKANASIKSDGKGGKEIIGYDEYLDAAQLLLAYGSQGEVELVELLLSTGVNANSCYGDDKSIDPLGKEVPIIKAIYKSLARAKKIKELNKIKAIFSNYGVKLAYLEQSAKEILLEKELKPIAKLLEKEKQIEKYTDLKSSVKKSSEIEEKESLTLEKAADEKSEKKEASKGTEKGKISKGKTLDIFQAAKYGDIAAIEAAIKAGQDVNKKKYGYLTPLLYALKNRHVDAVKYLLSIKEVDINLGADKYDPLLLAAFSRQTEILEQLINDPRLKLAIDIGKNKLYVGILTGNIELVKKCIASIDVNTCDKEGRSLLYLASGCGNKELVQLLLDAGADKDQAEKDGQTPLFIASQEGKVEVVKLLLDAGADKDQADIDGATPLYVAAQEGDGEVAKLLIDAGADKDKAKKEGATPLFIAAHLGHAEVAKLLIDAGADKKKAAGGGWTPILVASDRNDAEVVKLLLDAGADKDEMQNGCGRTALNIAAGSGHAEVVKLLIDAGADKDKASENPKDGSNYRGKTPLSEASEWGKVEIVKLLIDAGADKDKAKDGETPLDIAVEYRKDAVALLLIDYRAKCSTETRLELSRKGDGWKKAARAQLEEMEKNLAAKLSELENRLLKFKEQMAQFELQVVKWELKYDHNKLLTTKDGNKLLVDCIRSGDSKLFGQLWQNLTKQLFGTKITGAKAIEYSKKLKTLVLESLWPEACNSKNRKAEILEMLYTEYQNEIEQKGQLTDLYDIEGNHVLIKDKELAKLAKLYWLVNWPISLTEAIGGININKFNNLGNTLLHELIKLSPEQCKVIGKDKLGIIKDVLAIKGIDVNATSRKDQKTAAHLAVRTGQDEIFKQLKAKGADLTLKDHNNYSVEQYIQQEELSSFGTRFDQALKVSSNTEAEKVELKSVMESIKQGLKTVTDKEEINSEAIKKLSNEMNMLLKEGRLDTDKFIRIDKELKLITKKVQELAEGQDLIIASIEMQQQELEMQQEELLTKLAIKSKEEVEKLVTKKEQDRFEKQTLELEARIKSVVSSALKHDQIISTLSQDIRVLLKSDEFSLEQIELLRKQIKELNADKIALENEAVALKKQIQSVFKSSTKQDEVITELCHDVSSLVRFDDLNTEQFGNLREKIRQLEEMLKTSSAEVLSDKKLDLVKELPLKTLIASESASSATSIGLLDESAKAARRVGKGSEEEKLSPATSPISSSRATSTSPVRLIDISEAIGKQVLNKIKIRLEIIDVLGTDKQDEEFIDTIADQLRKLSKELLRLSQSDSGPKKIFETSLVNRLLEENEEKQFFVVTEIPMHLRHQGKITDALTVTKKFEIKYAKLTGKLWKQILEQVNTELKDQEVYSVVVLEFKNPILNDLEGLKEFAAKHGAKAANELIDLVGFILCPEQEQESAMFISGQVLGDYT